MAIETGRIRRGGGVVAVGGAALLVLAACAQNEPAEIFPGLIGHWEWLQSHGGYTGNTVTPITVGHNATVEFTSEGYCRGFVNGLSRYNLRAETARGSRFGNEDTLPLLRCEGADVEGAGFPLWYLDEVVVEIRGDTLMLTGTGSEARTHLFRRVRRPAGGERR